MSPPDDPPVSSTRPPPFSAAGQASVSPAACASTPSPKAAPPAEFVVRQAIPDLDCDLEPHAPVTGKLPDTPAKLGRPAALDAAKQREICLLISAGCSREEAARYMGCGRATIFRAARRDPAFAHALEQAEISRQYSQLQNVRRAAGHSWRAAAWLLERFNPNRFDRARGARYTSDQVAAVASRVCEWLITSEVEPSQHDSARKYASELIDELDSPGAIERCLKE
jgi:hypothetical protein